MPFWKPPKVEDLAREIARGQGKDEDAWLLFADQAEQLIALFAQELTGKNLPLPRRIMQIKARPQAIALEFASRAQADLFARCIQALKLRTDVEPEGETDGAAPIDIRISKAD